MHTYQTPLDLVRQRSPERPVAIARPDAVAVAARWFQENFRGDVFYAVKANPSPWVIETLAANGVTSFDVASIPEIELVSQFAPGSRMAFMHPVKSRSAISQAYFDHGVRTFALDTHEELAKILDATGGAKDLNLIVRLAVAAEGAAYSLSGKFGVDTFEAPGLLLAARRATQDLMGVSFHVGSQCMRPTAYQAAMTQASRALVRAGVFADVVDVGGGFPSIYPGMAPPALADYIDSIDRGFAEMMVHETTELWCEPGRALVAEGSSILTKVELRKGDALYLNDGSYGSLFDAAHTKWPFPVKLIRNEDGEAREVEGALKPYRFWGPTCDSLDHMPGPFWLPEDVREGDYVEIGMLGAYGVAMNTRFNGFGDAETIEVNDAPMASMFGLAKRSISVPKTENHNVVKLSRARGKKRRRK
ncbi:MAG: type III PLP-dependent enzyme [Phenylobacterium sp.]|uniref:type III PLP-dependent enzyme n=1 Tax=Phenylobacterium sp. TaxID=1871053 RepID=UPI00271EFA30|nr:type III PLP-dependent enzyme [Phenylobacterium sp.]MDO8321381.1 type III PLP-dependent enzyme [Phenylobacterium sp.]MDO8914406.1 type III PLP-dependent enzyme [Phenylobacterium sp.]MDP2010121.1 type III PLP-dependent enzyme [Phenylobacterium sp.]MDP3100139.1 type III PLP-dependent enzyme [Phenylobacterium sp.]MDP3869648.1 type III PLP-dependent enzyme [Phenylobacterium sp.]